MSNISTTEHLQQLLGDFKKEQLPAIEEAAANGDVTACFELGALYANGHGVKQNSQQARKWLKKAIAKKSTAARTLLAWLYLNDESLGQTDTDAIEAAVDEVIAANPAQVEKAKANPKLAGWFVGQVMKATGGKANPKAVIQLVAQKLDL